MIRPFSVYTPRVHPTARIAEDAVVVGDVTLAEGVSVWYHAVLRGDETSISVGPRTNIQDNAVLHCDPGFPLVLGSDVTVGHGAILHGCTVGDGALIGMGAILLDGCAIGENALVAAGALVTPNTVIPAGMLAVGSPAKAVRPLRPEELEHDRRGVRLYSDLSQAQLPLAGGVQ